MNEFTTTERKKNMRVTDCECRRVRGGYCLKITLKAKGKNVVYNRYYGRKEFGDAVSDMRKILFN